jgi:hypothetical protein
MTLPRAATLIDELNSLDESMRIEAKAASEIGKSIMETVSAFANEPELDGGYLLFGVATRPTLFEREYRAEGLENPEKIQAAYREINQTDTLDASGHLRRLRDLGLLEKKGSGNKTYYLPTPRFLHSLIQNSHRPPADSHRAGADSHRVPGDQTPTSTDIKSFLPSDLREILPPPGSKPKRHVVCQIIGRLCAWRALSASEIALLLGRKDRKPLVRDYLSPMVRSGDLVYTIPAVPDHPDQKYSAVSREP